MWSPNEVVVVVNKKMKSVILKNLNWQWSDRAILVSSVSNTASKGLHFKAAVKHLTK